MSKRKNGEGSWGTKTFKGVEYQYFRDSEGRYTYAKTLKELRKKLSDKDLNGPTKRIDTLQDYSLKYIKTFVRPNVSDKSFDTYEYFINTLINSSPVAHMQISAITSMQWQNLLNDLAANYSISTIKSVWAILQQVIKYAEINKDIPLNTTFGVKLPKESSCHTPTKKIPFISADDMEILWNESFRKTSKNGLPVYGDGALIVDFIMYTGLRVSEACALKYGDIDMDTKELTVSSTLSRILERDRNGNVMIKENGAKKQIILDKKPKTANSVRVIPLCQRALEIINIILKKCPDKKAEDYLFINRNNGCYSTQCITYTLRKMQENSSCSRKDYTPHCLRHGFGSILISKGADIKLVSELLGHSNVAFTYNVYIGIYKEDKRKAINLLD